MDEKQVILQAAETSRIVADMMQHYERENKRLWAAVLASIIAIVIMASCMIWAVMNAQRVANEAVLNALNTVAEMEVVTETTTTTTQSVEGDSATINNVDGEQYNDNAVNGGAE